MTIDITKRPVSSQWQTLSQEEKTEWFIHDATIIHGGLYDYSKTIYHKSDWKVEIICKTHGSFWQMPHKHLDGQGCRKCPRAIKRASVEKADTIKGKRPKRNTLKIMPGYKFHRLTVIEWIGERASGNTKRQLWKCRCDCGKETTITDTALRTGHTKSCGCLQSEVSSANGKKLGQINRKVHPMISTARSVWKHGRYDEGVSFERFLELSQLPCNYCGREPHRTTNFSARNNRVSQYQLQEGNFTYNGLDRVDSSKGHTEDNVVPCCFDCNHAKSDMTLDEFMLWIKSVSDHCLK